MGHKLQDINRRNLSFSKSSIKEVLPEYFAEAYPNLVLFLEKYYDFLEDEEAQSFKTDINNLFLVRDPGQTPEKYLNFLIEEIGDGLQANSFHANPRLMASLLAKFYRVKGSLNSIEGLFRGFYGDEITVEYPKQKMFIVGESHVGYESQRFIQNNELYQIFSILIKTSFATSKWRDLYLKYVHPAGFYYAGEIVLENEKLFDPTPFSENPLDVIETDIAVYAEAGFDPVLPFVELTGLYDSDGDTISDYRINLTSRVNTYQTFTIQQLNNYYSSISDLLTPNSFKFDDSDAQSRPDFSMTLETMDNDMYSSNDGIMI